MFESIENSEQVRWYEEYKWSGQSKALRLFAQCKCCFLSGRKVFMDAKLGEK